VEKQNDILYKAAPLALGSINLGVKRERKEGEKPKKGFWKKEKPAK
jgi:hypothetical protein